jgi:hypothetical protein
MNGLMDTQRNSEFTMLTELLKLELKNNLLNGINNTLLITLELIESKINIKTINCTFYIVFV